MEWPRTVLAGTGEIKVAQMPSFRIKQVDLDNKETAIQLQNSFEKDGFVMLKSFIQDSPLARQEIIDRLVKNGVSNQKLEIKGTNSPNLMQDQDWINTCSHLKAFLEHEALEKLAALLMYKTVAKPLPYKWLRAVGTGLFTGLHCDYVYVGHLAPVDSMITFWIPIAKTITTNEGSLIIAAGSHQDYQWKQVRDIYGKTTVGRDGTASGWLTSDPSNLRDWLLPRSSPRLKNPNLPIWLSEDFEAGDVVALNLGVMHITATNTTRKWRLSCDERFIAMP